MGRTPQLRGGLGMHPTETRAVEALPHQFESQLSRLCATADGQPESSWAIHLAANAAELLAADRVEYSQLADIPL
jgi:hypothetical protein